MTPHDIWHYGDTTWADADVVGFGVEALDGSIGTVDEATSDADGSYLVVDTGPWLVGRKVVLPGGVVDGVDPEDATIHVNRTKAEVKNAPELDEDGPLDRAHRQLFGEYWGPGGAGHREVDDARSLAERDRDDTKLL